MEKSAFCLFLVILCSEVSEQKHRPLNSTECLAEITECAVLNLTKLNADIESMRLRFYYGLVLPMHTEVKLDQSRSLYNHNYFNKKGKTVMFFYPYGQSVDSPINLIFYKMYHVEGGYNFILVDWSKLTLGAYNESVVMMEEASKAVARSIDDLIDTGAELYHITGFSLGAQFAGLIARNMRNHVRHIIAMDPAGPYFYGNHNCTTPISGGIAGCVEVIHSDMGALGAPVKTGDVDYYPNGGKRNQPGCNDATLTPKCDDYFGMECSHLMSVIVWITQFLHVGTFTGRQCDSWENFQKGLCNNNSRMVVGECTNGTRQQGNYYFKTTNAIPAEIIALLGELNNVL